jgi:dTDP-4-amino-4,6-dideoxygalactose transaminase
MLATPTRKAFSGTIPFNRAVRLGSEAKILGEFLESGNPESGGGPLGRQCEVLLERLVGKPVLVTSSATHALEMAALLARIGPGDEVIIPSYTFVSTANAFVLRGAKPVFADVDRRGNLVPAEIARLRTPKTRAVCVVHYAGDACDMSELKSAAEGLILVEDAAQAIGSRQRGQHLGTFGACGVLSFHETKNIGCGEGGALILGDEELLRRAEVLREKGTNRRSFQLGLVDKYTWVDVGSSYVLPEICAALLRAQLLERERIQERRAEISRRYLDQLGPVLRAKEIEIICTSPNSEGNHHLFAMVFPLSESRRKFIAGMRDREVSTPFHYVALHLSEVGRRFHDGSVLPNAEQLTECLVRLPLFFNMSDEMVEAVIDRAQEILATL